MKKLFTLVLVLLVATAGYSQMQSKFSKSNLKAVQEQVLIGDEVFDFVGSTPTMTKSDSELDYTYYDWQTNTAARNLTMNFPDGCVGFAYTYASDETMADRGTAIAIYNPNTDEWTTAGGSIEAEKTGFGCAARYGSNGIVVVSRNANTLKCGVYIIEDKNNLPAPNTLEPIYELDDTYNAHFPCVMCTGPDHKHIHILVTALNQTIDDQVNPYFYVRSMDGGQTWEEGMTIEYLGRAYCPQYGSGQDAYFMENNGEDRLSIVVNTRRGDGAVLNSYDEGNTWERQEYYHHPGIDADYGENLGYLYPRWTSAFYDNENHLHVAYEFGGGTGDASSTNYYPGIGGVAYWDDQMPYHGEGTEFGFDPNNPMPPVQGQPFIMDSAYLFQDIYASWWRFSDATHEMWPEYIGYVTTLGEDGEWENPYEATEFNIEDLTLHGGYNCGISAMPVLLTTPDQDLLVAIWIAMDENNTDDLGNYYFKLFTSASNDGGLTWTTMKHLTNTFLYTYTECVYPQAAITNNQLVIALQMDGGTDNYLLGDDSDPSDNYYQGLTYDLNELFGYDGMEENHIDKNTVISLYPNPVSSNLSVTLNQDEEIVISNMIGQTISTVRGHQGVNTIDVSNLNSGVYFINAGSASQKFVVK